MGAYTFMTLARGKTAIDAFHTAVKNALWEHGHNGYTGTIAEKDDFVMIDLPDGHEPHKFARELLDKDDRRIVDKWGPAGCVMIREGEFLFFGWASS